MYFNSKAMRSIALFILLMMGINIADAQNKEANVNVKISTIINAPADKVWEVLGQQFDDIADWTTVVKSSKAIEKTPTNIIADPSAPIPARETTSENKGKTITLVEVITEYSDENRSLKFYGDGLPSFIEFASDKQSVIEKGPHQSVVVFEVEVSLKSVFSIFKGKVEKRFEENFKRVQNDLKIYVERELVTK